MKAHGYHPTELVRGQRIYISDGIATILERRFDHKRCNGVDCVCIVVRIGRETCEYRLSSAAGETVWVIDDTEEP